MNTLGKNWNVLNEIGKNKSSKTAFPRQILGARNLVTTLGNKVYIRITSDNLTTFNWTIINAFNSICL